MAPQHIYESIDNLVVKFENMPTWKYTNLFLNAAKMSQRRHLQHLAFYILLCSWGQKIGIYMYRLTVNCIFIYNMFNICRNGGPNSWEQTALYMSNSTDAFCPCLKQGPHSQLQTTLWKLPLRQKVVTCVYVHTVLLAHVRAWYRTLERKPRFGGIYLWI